MAGIYDLSNYSPVSIRYNRKLQFEELHLKKNTDEQMKAPTFVGLQLQVKKMLTGGCNDTCQTQTVKMTWLILLIVDTLAFLSGEVTQSNQSIR